MQFEQLLKTKVTTTSQQTTQLLLWYNIEQQKVVNIRMLFPNRSEQRNGVKNEEIKIELQIKELIKIYQHLEYKNDL